MAIKITGDEIRFTSASGEITTYKQEDAKEVFVKRKSDDGLPMKRLRSFESASTFIDLNASGITPSGHSAPRPGMIKGDTIDIFVKDTYEALHIDSHLISIGPKSNTRLELTGSLFSNGISGSFDYSNVSWMQLENMAMDITQGGFFGLAVSGSTLASNLYNMANNLSGFFLTGSNVIISGSTELSGSTIITGGDTQITGSLIQSGSTTLTGGDVIISGSTELSGSTIITGGDTEITGSTIISGSTIITGGDTQITGSTIISGSTTITGGDTQITGSTVISGSTIITGGDTEITGSTIISGSTIITGGDTQITGSTILSGSTVITGGDTEITGSTTISGSTVITGGDTEITGSTTISGSTTVIISEFTQSGTSIFDGGTTTFTGISGSLSASLSGSDIAVEVSGTISVDGDVAVNYTNNAPISSSLTLTNGAHGLGRTLNVRSGSSPYIPSGPYSGLPVTTGVYNANPAGELELTLPAATIGLSFHVRNCGVNTFPYVQSGYQGPPSIKISPSGSNKFIYGAGGSTGVAGKAIINHSSSFQMGDFAVVSCVSQSHWMIQQMGGTWTDEA
jgi:hypothetical protein